MTTSTEIERLVVRAPDGVDLAVWVDGVGPPLVLVHGSIQDHTASMALVEALRRDFTTYAMDRRGFGASGDGASYDLTREFADVAAVVDAVATRGGHPEASVVLWGHSFGASCAMGGATLTENVSHLVLYEPSLGLRYPTGWIDRVERLVAEGDLETAIVMVLRDLVELTAEEIDQRRAEPGWQVRVATAPTIAREARAEQEWTYASHVMHRIVAPTLLLSGSESPTDIKRATEAARAAIPRAEVRLLPGEAHVAHRTAPGRVADVVRAFVTT